MKKESPEKSVYDYMQSKRKGKTRLYKAECQTAIIYCDEDNYTMFDGTIIFHRK